MTDRIKKWQVLEGLVAAIERALASVPNTRVILNARVPVRGSSKRRQVDIVVEIPTGPRLLRVGVEVRDKSHPLDVTQVEQLGAKLSNLELDRGCIVARSGFTRDAALESPRWGLELKTITEIEAPEWWLAPHFVTDTRQLELLTWHFGYESPILEEVRVSLLAQPPGSLELVEPGAPALSFRGAVDNWGITFLNSSGAPTFTDGETFWLQVELALPPGSFLRRGADTFPVPSSLMCQWRVTVKREHLPFSAFEVAPGVNAFSAVWASQGKQLSIVTQASPNGGRSYSMAVSEQAPRATALPPVRGETTGPSSTRASRPRASRRPPKET